MPSDVGIANGWDVSNGSVTALYSALSTYSRVGIVLDPQMTALEYLEKSNDSLGRGREDGWRMVEMIFPRIYLSAAYYLKNTHFTGNSSRKVTLRTRNFVDTIASGNETYTRYNCYILPFYYEPTLKIVDNLRIQFNVKATSS